MTRPKKAAGAAESVRAARPAKKLIPRTAPKAEAVIEAVAAEVPPVLVEPVIAEPVITEPLIPENAITETAAPATAAVAAKARRVRKPTREDETVAKHQKVLAEALVMAQAIDYEQPQVMRPAASGKGKKSSKPAKQPKAKKVKLVRDSYAMPEAEYAQINELKKRLSALGSEVKKSELLRGGIAALVALGDPELKTLIDGVERIKTGRPAK